MIESVPSDEFLIAAILSSLSILIYSGLFAGKGTEPTVATGFDPIYTKQFSSQTILYTPPLRVFD